MQLIKAAENQRRDYGHQNAAEGAPRSDGEIKGGEVFRRGLQAIKFAVANHAANEQPGGVDADLFIKRDVSALKQGPADRARTGNQGQGKRKSNIPARVGETDHETEEIEGQGQDPEERDNRDVLAEFVGDCEQ